MKNLHQIILQEYGLKAQHLFRDWERLWLSSSDYKNHRIFTLRCLHKDLIPVSIKLKTTLKTEKAKNIIRKAEKDLLQARVKAINSILDNISKQTELCRSQLASILSTQRLRECQSFVEKVGEIRFNKVKQRELNKFNNLLNKKEGNITRVTSLNSQNLASSKAGVHLTSREGSSLVASKAGAHLPSREGSILLASQASAHLAPGEGSSSAASQAGAHLPSREGSILLISQASAHLSPGEGSSLVVSQAGRQVLSIPQRKEATYYLPRQFRQVLIFSLGKEAV